MKLRHPVLIRWIAFLASILVRLYMSTLRYRYRPLGLTYNPYLGKGLEPSVFAFWHENILLPASKFGCRELTCLVSQHADGEIIARVLTHMGFGTIRGSSTRGGVQALRKMMAETKRSCIVMIPDGPRGPRRQVDPGVVFLASRSGLPVVPFGLGYEQAWRLKTWDRFVIPKPFSLVVMVTGLPIHIPAKARKDELEAYRLRVEQALDEVTRRAEELAGSRERTEIRRADRGARAA